MSRAKTVTVYLSPNVVFKDSKTGVELKREDVISELEVQTGVYVTRQDRPDSSLVIITPNGTVFPDATASQRASTAKMIMPIGLFVRLHSPGPMSRDRHTTYGPAAEL
jgi:hypothetical protein